MKKVALLLLITLCWSCSVDDGSGDNFSFEIVPIATVETPETLVANDVNRIEFTYNLQSSCHSYNDLYYIENGNQRTIAVVNLVTDTNEVGGECQPLTDVIDERGFDFFAPPGFSSVVFNFWQGQDENGQDVYLTMEIPVGPQ